MRNFIYILFLFTLFITQNGISQTIIFQSGFETGDPALTSSSTLGTITQPSSTLPRTGTKSGRIDEVSKLYKSNQTSKDLEKALTNLDECSGGKSAMLQGLALNTQVMQVMFRTQEKLCLDDCESKYEKQNSPYF